MNYRAIAHYLGLVLKLETLVMAPPLLISIYCGDYRTARAFAVTMGMLLLTGILLDLRKTDKKAIYTKESFLVVALCWVSISLFGALPFWLSGEIPSLVDALFESISGFSTTGATLLTDVEAMSKGLLFWRSATHWIGGMGVLVLLMAVMSGEEKVSVMRAESSGPAPGKLVPKLRRSSMILYGIYVGLTLLLILLLLAGGMPLYDSVANALSTAGTGGFAVKNLSIEAYGSLYAEIVIGVFMFLFGMNFTVFFYLLSANFRAACRHDEARAYVGVVVVAIGLITVNLAGTGLAWSDSLRLAAFQVPSVMTTCGFSTTDFSLWPQFSKIILFLLAISGACSGSTSGGIKITRVVILFKELRRYLFRMARPRAVGIVRMDGKAVDKRIVHGVSTYCVTYAFLFVLSLLLISLDNFDFETSITSVLACLGNVGPGFGMVSPMGDFSVYSPFSKLVLSLDMLLGRLEIYPVLLLFAPRTWKSL